MITKKITDTTMYTYNDLGCINGQTTTTTEELPDEYLNGIDVATGIEVSESSMTHFQQFLAMLLGALCGTILGDVIMGLLIVWIAA